MNYLCTGTDYIFFMTNGEDRPEMNLPPYSQMSSVFGEFKTHLEGWQSFCKSGVGEEAAAIEFKRPRNKSKLWKVKVYLNTLDAIQGLVSNGFQPPEMDDEYTELNAEIKQLVALKPDDGATQCLRVAQQLGGQARESIAHIERHLETWLQTMMSLMEIVRAQGLDWDAQTQMADRMRHVIVAGRQNGWGASMKVYTSLMSLYGSAHNVGGARSVWQEMQSDGLVLDAYAFTALLDAYAKVGSVAGVLDVFKEMREAGHQPDCVTFDSLMKAHIQAGDVSGAVGIMDEIRAARLQPNVVNFMTLLQCPAQRGDILRAEQVINDLQRSHQPSQRCFGALMYAYAKKGNVVGATKVVQEMKSHGLPHNAHSLNILMFAHACAADVKGARGVFLEKQEIEEKTGQYYTSHQNSIAWNTLLIAHANARDAEGAKAIAHDMLNAGVAVENSTVNYLLQSLFINDPEASSGMVHDFVEMGWEPDELGFLTLLSAYSKRGDVEHCQGVLKSMEKAGYPFTQTVHNRILAVYATRGDVTGMKNSFAAMQVSPNLQTFNTLLQGCIAADDETFANEVLKSMQKAGYRPDYITLRHLQKFGGCKGPKRAIDLLHESGHQLDQNVIEMLLSVMSVGVMDKTQQRLWVEGVIQQTQASGSKPNDYLFNSMLFVTLSAGHWEDLKTVLYQMRQAGHQPDPGIFQSMVDICCDRGDVEEGKQVLHEMQEAGYCPEQSMLHQLIAVCYRQGNVEGATSIAQELEETGHVLNKYDVTAALSSSAPESRPLFQQERKSTTAAGAKAELASHDGISQGPIQTAGLGVREEEFAKATKQAHLTQRLRAMKDEGIPEENRLKRTLKYNFNISFCAQEGCAEEAEYWMQQLLNDNEAVADCASYNIMMHLFAQTGDVKRARQWFERMQAQGIAPDEYSMGSMLNACAQARMHPGDAHMVVDAMGAPSQKIMNIVLNAFTEAGDMLGCTDFYKKCQARKLVNIVTINTVMKCTLRSLQGQTRWQQMETLLNESRTNGKRPSEYTYFYLLLACISEADKVRAAAFVDELLVDEIDATVKQPSELDPQDLPNEMFLSRKPKRYSLLYLLRWCLGPVSYQEYYNRNEKKIKEAAAASKSRPISKGDWLDSAHRDAGAFRENESWTCSCGWVNRFKGE